MADVELATLGGTSSGASYGYEWYRFVAWSEASGGRSQPATPEDVAPYLEYRTEAGARVSTIKVVAP